VKWPQHRSAATGDGLKKGPGAAGKEEKSVIHVFRLTRQAVQGKGPGLDSIVGPGREAQSQQILGGTNPSRPLEQRRVQMKPGMAD